MRLLHAGNAHGVTFVCGGLWDLLAAGPRRIAQRRAIAQAIGPILLGVGAPVHVLRTGAEVRDIVNIAAIAVMDASRR